MDNMIRTGELEDLETCYKILMASSLGKVYFKNKCPYRMIAGGLENEKITIILNDEKECMGFMWSEINGTFGKYPYLHMIVIEEGFQGKGIGKTLLRYFEDVVTINYDKVFLMVGDFNKDAKRLYEKLNYNVVGVFPNFYINGVDEYLMMKLK